ncbi:hypothetical protein SKB0092_14140 [Roseomonas mucosa]
MGTARRGIACDGHRPARTGPGKMGVPATGGFRSGIAQRSRSEGSEAAAGQAGASFAFGAPK